jgi:hypothetical protein
MSMYMIKVHDGLKGLKGLETILMEDRRDYEVGQTITVSPEDTITVQDQHGNGVRLSPKVSLLGTVVEKRY